ncbi:mediator of RNA polymerase II transcription subunit 19a-like isoform X3 [Carex littledalei]|uniref:Mediator of RNA polymerase II transcription subunit 19a-like isoform X3 n=1 Tax=Carex littledalei TaxID=544730 RepID=A0A833VFM3_9POAL|nr:mediator of RNA polymerase II transcription subunit 19a-like isoform X3 [Carex littledalei]
MDQFGRHFGRGPRELTGAVDLINQYKLLAHHKFFCKRALPASIRETHYLRNVVGERDIMRGEGMEFDQLFENAPYLPETKARISTFDLETLGQAFQLRENGTVHLPSLEKGTPTISCKITSEEEKEKKHKKKRDREGGDKERERKKHKHRHHKDKDKEIEKDKEKEKRKHANGHYPLPPIVDPSKRHHDKFSHGATNLLSSQQKRNHGFSEDLLSINRHKRGLLV